eukprot:TRINITY_DN2354_c0_g1_i1.p1 TRINITY_DN2354_c0_g1~~TRINITY_DN2354_c0_g1_i1.p1  ORF type:complete len:478 (-),score=118.07 TRINITY_DN2354_c0_g1_i1:255-1688(-)
MSDPEGWLRYKDEANVLFSKNKFVQAVLLYSKAIELNPENAGLWTNRSLAHIKLEEYGSAIEDADKALSVDSGFTKAYYRKGSALFGLGKHKEALDEYVKAQKMHKSDPDLQKRINECKRFLRRIAMEKAIERETEFSVITSVRMSIGNLKLPDYYVGPSWEVGESIPSNLGPRMVELFKEGKLPPERVAQQILLAAFDHLDTLPSLVHIEVPKKKHITVCGDTHGQFFDVVHIFEENGMPSKENPYLFNGDYVDRGSFSVEVILALLSFMITDPESIYLARGNHESRGLNQMYGFSGEVAAKYNPKMYEVFLEVFRVLPLCHVLNKKVIVIHGGLPRQGNVTLSEIASIDRKREIPEDGVMTDLLWADPGDVPGISMSKRGTSRAFGADITKLFLETNNLSLLVRSHEMMMDGYSVTHDGKCITVFSAPNYCDAMGNLGAYIHFDGDDMEPVFFKFSASPHPAVRAMQFANPLLGL